MSLTEVLLGFSVALAVSVVLTPRIRSIAIARGLLDYPDNERRKHREPVPRLGGVAVFLGFMLSLVVAAAFRVMRQGDVGSGIISHLPELFVACLILFAIGVADDLRGVPPAAKLLGQAAAALIVQYKWTLISNITLPPDITVDLHGFGLPIGTLWLVGMSNALNLVDGLDGLAGTVSVIAVLTSAVAAFTLGNTETVVVSAALCGALVGFLKCNLPPARMFLGDCGSLVIGFLLALLTVHQSTTSGGSVLLLVPLFALSYPLVDTGIAILRRWLREHPLSRADGRHVHHQLLALGLSGERALVVICLYSIGVAGLGLSVTFAPPAFTIAVAAVSAAILGLVFIYGIRWLDYHEFVDAGAIIVSAGTLAREAIRDSIHARDVARLLERAMSLVEVDDILEANADLFRFAHMHVGTGNSMLPDEKSHRVANLWKLEYPVVDPDVRVAQQARVQQPLVLSIWCARAATVRAARAERVARILASAIANWMTDASPDAQRDVRARVDTPPRGIRLRELSEADEIRRDLRA